MVVFEKLKIVLSQVRYWCAPIIGHGDEDVDQFHVHFERGVITGILRFVFGRCWRLRATRPWRLRHASRRLRLAHGGGQNQIESWNSHAGLLSWMQGLSKSCQPRVAREKAHRPPTRPHLQNVLSSKSVQSF